MRLHGCFFGGRFEAVEANGLPASEGFPALVFAQFDAVVVGRCAPDVEARSGGEEFVVLVTEGCEGSVLGVQANSEAVGFSGDCASGFCEGEGIYFGTNG